MRRLLVLATISLSLVGCMTPRRTGFRFQIDRQPDVDVSLLLRDILDRSALTPVQVIPAQGAERVIPSVHFGPREGPGCQQLASDTRVFLALDDMAATMDRIERRLSGLVAPMPKTCPKNRPEQP